MTLGFQVLSAWGVSWLAQRSGASAGVAMCLGICLVCVAPILPLEVAAEADLYPAGFPVVVTACAWRWWGGHQVSWGRALSFAVASVAVLLWTVIGTTALAGGGTAIIAPLAVLRSWGGVTVPVDALSIAARACSDLAFPIAILVLWPDARRFPSLLLAWAAYGIGLGQGLLLAETGHRMYDGNFMWSPQLATFGVTAASPAWLGRSSVQWNWRVIAAWSLLLAPRRLWSVVDQCSHYGEVSTTCRGRPFAAQGGRRFAPHLSPTGTRYCVPHSRWLEALKAPAGL